MTKEVGIYVHVPFCRSKCYYCDFCSRTHADEDVKELYTQRLCEEIEKVAAQIGADRPIADTVYFGGGTPTLLSAEQFDRVLNVIDANFGVEKDAEITAETNPKTANRKKLAEMRRLGINRLSIGMQSVHDSELKALGRIHSFDDFFNTYYDARRVGFENISVDLMYGIPQQTRESFGRSVETLAVAGPEHISSYALTVEEGTNFYRRRDGLDLPDEDTVSDMYADMGEILAKYGYQKYEISNFSKEGKESRHNMKYWTGESYLGFGSAAHSYFDGVRFAHSRDIAAYIEGKCTIIDVEPIDKREAMNEYVMLGMRLSRGIDILDFKARFGEELFEIFGKIKQYSSDFVDISEERCRFTEKGMFVSNSILSDVLDFGE